MSLYVAVYATAVLVTILAGAAYFMACQLDHLTSSVDRLRREISELRLRITEPPRPKIAVDDLYPNLPR